MVPLDYKNMQPACLWRRAGGIPTSIKIRSHTKSLSSLVFLFVPDSNCCVSLSLLQNCAEQGGREGQARAQPAAAAAADQLRVGAAADDISDHPRTPSHRLVAARHHHPSKNRFL